MNKLNVIILLTLCAAIRAEDDKVFDVPKLDGITIDGKTEDWGDKGLMVDNLKDSDGKAPKVSDCKAAFRLGWNDDGLLVAIWVVDDVALEPEEKVTDLWKGDSIEIFMATARGAPDHMQVVIAPGRDPNHKELRSNVSDYRKEKKGKLTVKAERTLTDNGYTMEVLIPWKNLNIEAGDGKEIGFQFFVNDVDKPGERHQLLWYPKPDAHADTNNMYRLKLAAKAAAAAPAPAVAPVVSAKPVVPPADAKVEANVQKVLAAPGGTQIKMEANLKEPSLKVTEAVMEDGRGLITVSGAGKLKGKQIKVKDGDKNMGKGKLEAEGDTAVAKIKLDKPKEKSYGPLTVTYDDEPIATVKLPE